MRNKPGSILTLKYIDTDPPYISYGKFNVAMFYMEYWSNADGGSKIAAKLFIPIGDPPKEGWPVKVWLHGFGGPGYDYWRWPVEKYWKDNERGYAAGISFSNHGFISLCPWVTGFGPSEPFATYSPLSLKRNAQAAYDGFIALKNLSEYFYQNPELVKKAKVKVIVDNDRQVMSTNCISSPTLMYFAAHLKEHPETINLKCLIADVFQPSVAYIIYCVSPWALKADGKVGAAAFSLWAGPIWCLAEREKWDMSLFFTEKAIELFNKPLETYAGTFSLMRGSILEPLEESHVAPKLYETVKKDVGRKPTTKEIVDWMYTDNMKRLLEYKSMDEILTDDFYQKFFANSDPFFETNIEPFSIDIPLLVVANGEITSQPSGADGLPGGVRRYYCMTEPRIRTLRKWGWRVHVFFKEGVKVISFHENPNHKWVIKKLAKILYPKGVPEELKRL